MSSEDVRSDTHDDGSRYEESEQRYRALLANAPLVFFTVDRDGRLTVAEGRGFDALGIGRAAIIGRSVVETFGQVEVVERSGAVTPIGDAIARVLRGETVVGLTALKGRYFENSLIPTHAADGTVSGMMGIAFDVTDLHRSAEALRSSESYVRTILDRDVTERERATAESRLLQDVTRRVAEAGDTDAALEAVMRLVCQTITWDCAEAWTPSKDGSTLELSPTWFCIGEQRDAFRQASLPIKFAPGEGLPGRAWATRRCVWTADLPADADYRRRDAALAAGFRTGLAIPIAADDPTSPLIAVVVFYSLDRLEEDPRLEDLLTAVMTQLGSAVQRKQAELALQSSQKLLQSVVTSAPVIVFALDRDGVFTLSEGRGLEELGLKPGQLVGASALTVYSDVPDVVAHLRRALAGETFIGTAHVASRTYQTWYSPITDAAGGIAGVVGVATDVTEQRELEEQLRQVQRLESVGRLAGGIAHDFNNMLTAITGYAELIVDRLPPGEPLREEALEIKRAADQATLLTYQLLAFSRKQILRPETINLNDAVVDVSRMLQRLLGEDITIEARLAPDLGAVNADPGQIAQVIINLSVNARDAMPQGGVLTIETANVQLDSEYVDGHSDVRSGAFVMLAVSDTGTGMSPDVQKRIFEPFFTTKGVGKGTGMGLATVYGIVKQSGGHVWVYSEVGEGSTFKIYLPRVAFADTRADAGPADPGMARGVETILLVEDEPMVRRLVRRALEGCGYVVLEAPDGETALDIYQQQGASLALVITDVVMPRMSGRELMEQLWARSPSLRVLYISGYTDSDVFHHGGMEEVTYFLQKPFTMRALTAKVREILDA